MKTEIIQKNKNPFLMREEILIEIIKESAPSIEEVKESLGKKSDKVVVRKIHSNFGTNRFIAEVLVYDSLEAMSKVETIPKKIKKKLEEEIKAKAEAEKKKAEEEAKAELQAEKEKETKDIEKIEEKIDESIKEKIEKATEEKTEEVNDNEEKKG